MSVIGAMGVDLNVIIVLEGMMFVCMMLYSNAEDLVGKVKEVEARKEERQVTGVKRVKVVMTVRNIIHMAGI